MSKIFLRFLSGLLSGIIGTIIFIAIFFSTQEFTNIGTEAEILFGEKTLLLVIFSVFITTLIFSLSTNIFNYLTDREKYPYFKTTVLTCLSGNIALEVIIIPMYLLYGITNSQNLYVVILLQLGSFILLNQLIIEHIAKSKNLLAQSLSTVISIMIGILLIVIIGKVNTLLAVFSTPLLLMSLLGLASGISDLYPELKKTEDQKKPLYAPMQNINSAEIEITPEEIDLSHDYSKDREKF